VNASRAIAYQVSAAVNKFVGNFVIAVNPQIIKYYATGENQKMMNLVFLSSKYSYYLLFVIAMPIIMETDFILTLWLNQIPEYLIIFTRLIVITALLDSLSFPLMTAAQATGKIRKYQSVVGGMMLVNLPMSFCFLKLGFPPQSTMYIALCISFVCLFLRLWMLKNMVGLSIIDFFKVVFFRVMMVSFLAYIIPLFLYFQLHENILRFFILLCTGFITSILSIYKFGISVNERSIIKKTIKNYVLKHNYPN
ncbi:MAG: lipopolysaccharide biosynthesis protein, partial [Bacteroides sp.]|nr:lipopolysaccharide biosynthesis protein [Bacteroides sp.]